MNTDNPYNLDMESTEPQAMCSERAGEEVLKDASQGDEVAMAIDGVTVGRQIDVEDVIYVELMESTIKELQTKADLNEDEKMTLEEYLEIKRKSDPFWGM